MVWQYVTPPVQKRITALLNQNVEKKDLTILKNNTYGSQPERLSVVYHWAICLGTLTTGLLFAALSISLLLCCCCKRKRQEIKRWYKEHYATVMIALSDHWNRTGPTSTKELIMWQVEVKGWRPWIQISLTNQSKKGKSQRNAYFSDKKGE